MATHTDPSTQGTTATISLATLTATVVSSKVGEGDTAVALVASTTCVGLFYLAVRRGVEEAAAINRGANGAAASSVARSS